jgi:uncharacterized damage-inducible protein DinB
MSTTVAETQVISPRKLLKHWQGHRALTRRVIEKFPERDFAGFSIAGMRTPAQLTAELLSIGGPALKAIIERDSQPYSESGLNLLTKEDYLEKWDAETELINDYWQQLTVDDFSKTFNLFGQYEFPIIENIFYFIDNEIHHRGQMYVYLRALNIEPPFFWER